MNKKINGSPASIRTTEDFPIISARNVFLKIRFAITIIAVISFIIGFSVCALIQPKTETAKPPPPPITTAKPKHDIAPVDIGLELDRLARAKVVNFLRESWLGVLEIRDGKAITVRYKRAALGNKNGFTDLKNDASYVVHNYFVNGDKGYGIVDDGNRNFFLAIWYPGITKVPLTNPGTIRIPSGDRIETGNP